MTIHDLRDYYARQEVSAALQMMSHEDGTLQQISAVESWQYMRDMHYKYAALCSEAKL